MSSPKKSIKSTFKCSFWYRRIKKCTPGCVQQTSFQACCISRWNFRSNNSQSERKDEATLSGLCLMQKPVCFCMLGDERDTCVTSHQTSEEEEGVWLGSSWMGTGALAAFTSHPFLYSFFLCFLSNGICFDMTSADRTQTVWCCQENSVNWKTGLHLKEAAEDALLLLSEPDNIMPLSRCRNCQR